MVAATATVAVVEVLVEVAVRSMKERAVTASITCLAISFLLISSFLSGFIRE